MTDPGDVSTVDRLPGRRGQVTRQKLLDAATGLLESSTYRDLKVVDIARDAGTSPATFYQYFADVEDAVLVIADEMASNVGPDLASRIVGRTWSGEDAWQASLDIADGFIELWDRDRPVLRVIDLATDEGDARFRNVRTRLLGAPAEAFVEVLQSRDPSASRSMALSDAGVLVSMLAHVAAHRDGLEQWGARGTDLRSSMARVVFTTMTGQSVPDSF
jgi:AcrR family transcriptional regulator